MTRYKLLLGTAGLGLFVSSVAALAQQAPAGQTAAAQAPASQAPAPQDCSWLGCLFGSRSPSPRPEEAQALRANEDAARAEGATEAKPIRKAAKPVRQVVIAAEASEIVKLKRLAAAMPKEKIKIVAVGGTKAKTNSDFSVSTDLAPSQSERAKLFTEQMHIVAGGAVQSISDLEGKVVSFGPDQSPSQAAARKAFAALNVTVQETPLDVDNALDGLTTGDVQAVVMLAPQPIERLKTVAAPGVHLVSWPDNGTLPNGAVASQIDPSAYPGLAKPGDKIAAMGVDATLNISQKGARQSAAKGFLKALSEHSDALNKRGFDLLKADLDARKGRFLASADKP